jgi:tRNA synthetases class I (I, L, M and V)
MRSSPSAHSQLNHLRYRGVHAEPQAPPFVSLSTAATAEDGEMAKQYSFAAVEAPLYAWWEQRGYFKPGGDPTKPAYVVPMPPPNVTGHLHMGHAMFVALQVTSRGTLKHRCGVHYILCVSIHAYSSVHQAHVYILLLADIANKRHRPAAHGARQFRRAAGDCSCNLPW